MTGEIDGIEIRVLQSGDEALLGRVAAGVFDGVVRPSLVEAFLADRRHHIAVALDGGLVVGMVSALSYVHPDKPEQMFINELGTADEYRGRGIATALVHEMFAHAGEIGVRDVWLATENDNAAARAVYKKLGMRETGGIVMYEVRVGDRSSPG